MCVYTDQNSQTTETRMEKVTGIGGIFFRSANPSELAEWYKTHLGINLTPTDLASEPWRTDAGITVFSPFAEDTTYFPAHQQVMVNFRVLDLDAMLAQLHAAGISSFNEQTMEGVGKFAHVADPEGNVFELWEPAP